MDRPRDQERREFDDIEQGKDQKVGRKGEFDDIEQGKDVTEHHASVEDVPDEADPHVEEQLDHGLKETFPASDPVSINPGAD